MFDQTKSRPEGRARQSGKPLVVCPDSRMAVQIRSTLDGQGFPDVEVVTEYPRTGDIAPLMARQGACLCFLDVASNPEQALLLIPEAASLAPVVALNPCNDADLILRCLRRGASEFLSDATPEQVAGVLERLARLRTPAVPQKPSRVYCVLPGKPGCGASTVAAYLALELHRSGVSKVLLVDADLVTASIAFLFKLKSDFHVGDALRDCTRMDSDLWSRLVVSYQGVDVLLAPQDPSARVAFEDHAADELLAFCRKHYEAVILDLPGALSAASSFFASCDEVLLVTTNELASLYATRRSIECLEKSFVDRGRLKLLVTRYTPSTGLKREDVQTALKVEPWALLSNDYEGVQAALLEGQPVASASYFGRSVRALAERLLGKAEPPKKRASFFGLLPAR